MQMIINNSQLQLYIQFPQEEINKQNTREKTQEAIDMCRNCYFYTKFCQCTYINAKDTNRSKNGFRDGVKPPGPASKRNKEGK